MDLRAGHSLLHYRIVDSIGQGGMGEVWKAFDSVLDREVAIKVLPQAVADDPERRARFEREAKVLASLIHPNVAAVFGLHEADGVHFLAMELVPGEDLAKRLARGPMGIHETIDVGRQIASALEAAHAAGVVHRDLKPANVLRTPDGRVKVVDFGLARAGEPPAGTSLDGSLSPTLTTPASVAGALLGTAAYMSPEQARGRTVDRRADLWAFGCVLYECLTGRKAFPGDTVTDTLAAVLRAEPEWGDLPENIPTRLRELIQRCLAKDPERRWRDPGDAMLELESVAGGMGDLIAEQPSGRRVGLWPIAVALGVGLVAGGLGAFLGALGSGAPPRVVQTSSRLADAWTPVVTRLSPDGTAVAVVAWPRNPTADGGHLFTRRLDEPDYRLRDGAIYDWTVRFSPDSTQLAFIVRETAGASGPALVRAPADGSSPASLIAPWEDDWLSDFAWTSDSEVALVARDPVRLVRLPLDGRDRPSDAPIRIESSLQRYLLHSLLPDGSMLGTVESWTGGYHQDVARLDPATGEVTVLVDRGFEPVLTPDAKLLFSRRDQLLAVPYDVRSQRVKGAPEVVATGMRSQVEVTAALFSLSDRGDLAYLEGGVVGAKREIVWLETDGRSAPWGVEVGPYAAGQMDDSQDGRVMAVVQVGSSGLYDVWASEVDDPALRRTVAQEGMDCIDPVVSPDGRWVAARCIGDRERDGVYVNRFPSVQTEGRRVIAAVDSRLSTVPASWLPDGQGLLVIEGVAGLGRLLRLDLDADGAPVGEPRALEGLDDAVGFAMVSPDGRLLGYTESDGQTRVLQIASWNDGRPGPSRPLSQVGGGGFDWTGVRREGAWEIALIGPDGRPKSALVDDSGRTVRIDPGRVPDEPSMLGYTYLSDGRVLAIAPDPVENEAPAIRIITDWTSTLEE